MCVWLRLGRGKQVLWLTGQDGLAERIGEVIMLIGALLLPLVLIWLWCITVLGIMFVVVLMFKSVAAVVIVILVIVFSFGIASQV